MCLARVIDVKVEDEVIAFKIVSGIRLMEDYLPVTYEPLYQCHPRMKLKQEYTDYISTPLLANDGQAYNSGFHGFPELRDAIQHMYETCIWLYKNSLFMHQRIHLVIVKLSEVRTYGIDVSGYPCYVARKQTILADLGEYPMTPDGSFQVPALASTYFENKYQQYLDNAKQEKDISTQGVNNG